MEEEVTLRDYIWKKHGVDIDKIASEENNTAPSSATNSGVSSGHELTLPQDYIRSFSELILNCEQDFQTELYPTLDTIATELLQLEDRYEVALHNPAVTEAGERARNNWIRAKSLWQRTFYKAGDKAARRAIYFSLDSLLAAYQHTAAHKIVLARNFIEQREWQEDPAPLIVIHKEARFYYESGRIAQIQKNYDLARRNFKKSILQIRRFYLKVESAQHFMDMDMDMDPNLPV